MTPYYHHLRHFVRVQKRSFIPDGEGGFQEHWEPLTQTWVGITPLTSPDGTRKGLQEERGIKKGLLEDSPHFYKIMARVQPFLFQRGMRLQWKNTWLMVLEEPLDHEGYQFFHASAARQSDGGKHHDA